MKKIIVLLAVICLYHTSYSQPYFQKITTGEIVNSVTSSDRCAWGDYDNDGFQDLVISGYADNCQTCNFPILLYHNNGDGTFTRITTGPIATYSGRTFGCAWGDYDNDGKLDLMVCVGFQQNNLLFHNEGNGVFTQVTIGPIVNDIGWSQACAWCDYDRDGWLDLFVSNEYNKPNFLYHNNGNGTFTKVTSGSIVNDIGWSRGAAWGDYDNDGWPDLFVVNYQGINDFLYHNNGNGTFTKITSGPEVTDIDWGSGCSWGDYDNDGYLDLYVTNNNTPNRLYHNNGNGTFTLSPTQPSLENGLSFGSGWEDFDNDGYLDLFVAKQQTSNALFKNFNGVSFSRVSNDVVGIDGGFSAFGIWGDYNNDGKIDLFVSNTGSPTTNFLYKNVSNGGNYVICKLKGGCHSNKSGIGARINLYSGNLSEIREISGGSSMGTQDMLWQHFGVGNHSMIDSIIVSWPYGNTPELQKLRNIPVNQTITIEECVIGIKSNNNQIPLDYSLLQNHPNPFNPTTKIKFELPASDDVKLKIYDNLGNEVTTLIDSKLNAGYYEIEFKGENLSSGVYFYKLIAGNYIVTRKMVLIK